MDQTIVFATLGLALVLFAWGKIRHDLTAVICLLLLTLTGIIPAGEAFMGFAHPAVITVAAILVVSKGLEYSGLIELIGQKVAMVGSNLIVQVFVLSAIVCVASSFMNNVGALAVFMPVAVHIAVKHNHSPSKVLMPIAFASLLGGMMTLIGTPPNIIISIFRADHLGAGYGMFDFAPVGIGLSIVGLLFVSLIGWRFLPQRVSESSEKDRFNIDDYITEIIIRKESKLNGVRLAEIKEVTDSNILVLNVIRRNQLIHAPNKNLRMQEGDILTIEAESEELKLFLDKSGTVLLAKEEGRAVAAGEENISNVEAVVMDSAYILGQTASSMQMRTRFGVNLLAISRQGRQLQRRIDHVHFEVGDVLLLQGATSKIFDVLNTLGCLPLADRGFVLDKPRKIFTALGIFIIGMVLVMTGVVEVQIGFTLVALGMVLSRILPVRQLYSSIDWPVIVLLGAMLPLGTALEQSGGADRIAAGLVSIGQNLPIWGSLAILLIVTMLLSNIINNAATIVLMAPIGLNIAQTLNVSPDPFLMTVAVASSAAFMTPIGHQSNTLVMGPGGYKFLDYTRMGTPMSIILIVIAIPLILYFWPL
jgi:di/tricarboxylate transporter